MSKNKLEKLKKSACEFKKVTFSDKILDCTCCMKEKARKKLYAGIGPRAPSEIVHSNIMGPIRLCGYLTDHS